MKFRRQRYPQDQAIDTLPLFHYGRREFIMSPLEHELFKILRELVGQKYYVFPQMQLSFIFRGRYKRHTPRFMDALRHINQKSVDYIICDLQTTEPILIIELDGWSHRLRERRYRDNEVNRIAAEAGVHILHLQNIENMTHEELMGHLRKALPKLNPAPLS